MKPSVPPDRFRVLLLPPTQRDAEVLHRVLSGEAIGCEVCEGLSTLCAAAAVAAGAVLISEEALLGGDDALKAYVESQPVWSDLPIIVLSRSGAEAPTLSNTLATLGNVSVLERPVRITTLISVVRSALRARARQYEVQMRLVELASAEEARRVLLESERVARGEAERASRMKDEFLATLSHELRTPLNAILGWAILLSREPQPDENVRTGIEVIERNARTQAKIIEDLLDMSRIISGKVQLDIQPIDLVRLIEHSVETARPAALAKGVALSTALQPLGNPVPADPNRMQQVLWNLLSNAVKFTPSGGEVRVTLGPRASILELSVSDTGEGIGAAFLPFVFDRFRQADASTTRRHGGLGLGLGIVKQLVELHGGSVSAKSDGVGRGTTITLSLPNHGTRIGLGTPDVSGHPADRTAESTASQPISDFCKQLHGMQIVVVDDEPDARDLVKRLLTECSAEVFAVQSAAEVFARFQVAKPDLLISDIGMPDEDGYTLMRRLRKLSREKGGHVPAIALTAYARQEDRDQALAAGFQAHLPKPVDPSELIGCIGELLGRVNHAPAATNHAHS